MALTGAVCIGAFLTESDLECTKVVHGPRHASGDAVVQDENALAPHQANVRSTCPPGAW